MTYGKWLVALAASAVTTTASALLCPTNFNQINLGDSIAAVKAACGIPVSEKTADATTSAPQEWNYYVSVNPAFTQNMSQNQTASLKTTVAFDDGKVTNISVNGVGVSNTSVCGGTIQVGDAENTVQAACGKPAFINRGNGSQDGTQYKDKNASANKTTVLTYQNGNTPVTLTFEKGVLTARQ